ncbi:MAG: PD-(D/E)XK nuclease family protein [Schaedlerella sp.]|nr:PD-(D/E)XK nuclease family protein [Schaedlerella sp.]
MALHFIFGNSGSGKSHYLYDYVTKESIKYPKTNYFVLVPEQFTMQTQKDLCSIHPRQGIMNIDVLSFVRLSHRIFEETGHRIGNILDDEGKNLILRKIAGECENDFKVLRGNLKRQGYINEVKSVISEFAQYGINIDCLDEFLQELESESYLYYKLLDIRKIYHDFENYLADQYITKEELLDVLSSVIPESNILKDSVVVLDGYTGFTPVQNKLLGELMKVCKDIFITAEMDRRVDPFVYEHPYQLFAISKQMVTSLVKIAAENHIKIESPVYLYEDIPIRFRNAPALGFLEQNLFRYSQKKFVDEQEQISVHVTHNPAKEAEFVASELHKLVRKNGYRYRDMAVVVSDMETYAIHLQRACEEFQIPYFMDHKKSILLNAFIEYIRSLLGMFEQRFSYESVFRFLRTGMTEFTMTEIDKLENYVLALGLKGYKKWQSAWVRRTSTVDEEDLAELNHLRVRFIEKIDGLQMILKMRNKTVKDITEAVYDFLVKEQMEEKTHEMENLFQENNELALAKEYSQIYRIVIELFDKFVDLLGKEKISLKEYCELLDAGLEEAKVGVIPPGIDQVVIGDMERTRLNNLKVLFFMGANDTFLPGKLGQGGILSEKDREKFAEKKVSLSPGSKEQAYTQKFYLYMNLTKPSEKLYISYSKVSSDGKTLRPAYLVQDLKQLFEKFQVVDEEKRELSEYEWTQKRGEMYLAEKLRDRVRGLGEDWKEMYTWYKKEGNYKNLLDAAFYKKEKEQLDTKEAEDLFGNMNRFSVTRLEKFSSCAYAHFLTYGLHLAERERYQFEAIDLGNIAHQSLERYAKKLDKHRMDWIEVSENVRQELINEAVEESIVDYGNTVLYSSARNEYTIVRIKKLISRTVWAITRQMEKGDFKPKGYELKFGSGKIDRLDTYEEADKVFVKVTDYKTGRKAFDITAMYHGLQMQLPVYLNAAMELEGSKKKEKEIIPAGFFYYRMEDPIVDKETGKNAEDKILKELRLDGMVNADEEVLKHLERNLSGASDCIPVSRKKDGELSKTSKILLPEEFDIFLKFTKQKEDYIKKNIFEGNVNVSPYKLGENTGCDYCEYQSICGFDSRIDGYEYRNLKKYSQEDVIALMRDEVKNKEENGKKEVQ